jgi:hypothetical protein
MSAVVVVAVVVQLQDTFAPAVEYFCTLFQVRSVANPTLRAEAACLALNVVKAKAKGIPKETIVGWRSET